MAVVGRLGYNPNLSNERFIGIIQTRFTNVDAEKLFEAWQAASMVYPLTTGYHWGSLDFQWYIEACKSRPGPANTQSGFHDVNRFITLSPHPSSGYVSIPDYVATTLEGNQVNGIGPLDISDQIHELADRALRLLRNLDTDCDGELTETLQDIESMAFLGKYYACKIHGATDLHMYRLSGNKMFQREAISQLEKAADYWRLYVDALKLRYKNPLWTNRVGIVDWEKLSHEVHDDIGIARAAQTTSMPETK